MPIGWHETIPHIMRKVEQLNPQSILDVGVGFGKFGVLLREKLELPFNRYEKSTWRLQIDGVEAFTGYQNPLHEYVYNRVYYENIATLVDQLPHYDVILMINVLERFEKSAGLALLKSLLPKTKKAIIISTPQYPDRPTEYMGNKFEEHKSRWTNIDLCEFDFISESVRIETNQALIYILFPPSETAVGSPSADQVKSKPLVLKKNQLTIGYFLPHHNLTGGLKMLLEQMRQLQKLGHRIVAFYRGDPGEDVLPTWFDLQVDKEVLVPKNESYLSYLDDCEIGIAGWLEQIPELASASIPIVYWEQGNEWIFGDHLTLAHRTYLQQCFAQPIELASVSPFVAKILAARYQRTSKVIPNGIDVDFYQPGKPSNNNVILLVGNPNLHFKGFDVAIRTLLRVWKSGYRFKVKWVSPVNPKLDSIPFPFPIEYVVNPPQRELAQLYRNADLFLFTSWYEGFGMPPLEAMASGVPVVATRCGGIDAYMVDRVNAILVDPGDVNGLSEGIIHLLKNPQERQVFSKNGRDTAMQFSFANIANQLEQYLVSLVQKQ